MSTWVAVSDSDIVARWRPLTSAEESVSGAIIQDAQDILETALQDRRGWEAAPIDSRAERWARMYISVVANMAIRVLKNPDALLSETIDDYTYRRDSAISAGALYVSDSELDSLGVPSGKRRRGSFTITPR